MDSDVYLGAAFNVVYVMTPHPPFTQRGYAYISPKIEHAYITLRAAETDNFKLVCDA